MSRFDHTAVGNSCRVERSLGHHTVRAYPNPARRLIVSKTILSADHEWVGITKVWASPVPGPLFMAARIGPAFRFAFGKDFPSVHDDQIRSMYAGLTGSARRSLLAFNRRLYQAEVL
ncbi:MAG: hypothetical protein AAFX07_00010 [Pseudomonadota bacterium]